MAVLSIKETTMATSLTPSLTTTLLPITWRTTSLNSSLTRTRFLLVTPSHSVSTWIGRRRPIARCSIVTTRSKISPSASLHRTLSSAGKQQTLQTDSTSVYGASSVRRWQVLMIATHTASLSRALRQAAPATTMRSLRASVSLFRSK